jgi:hypothetical protein
VENITVKCAWCGDEKGVTPSYAEKYDRHFCGDGHRGDWMSEAQRGENHPNWVENVTVECEWCNTEKEVSRHEYRRCEKHFCADGGCQAEWQAKHFTGEGNPAWLGGIPQYGTEWTYELRETIRDRQDRECAGCGTHEDEYSRKHDVHHIQKVRSIGDDEAKSDDSILVALCRSCHQDWEQLTPLRPQTPRLN